VPVPVLLLVPVPVSALLWQPQHRGTGRKQSAMHNDAQPPSTTYRCRSTSEFCDISTCARTKVHSHQGTSLLLITRPAYSWAG